VIPQRTTSAVDTLTSPLPQDTPTATRSGNPEQVPPAHRIRSALAGAASAAKQQRGGRAYQVRLHPFIWSIFLSGTRTSWSFFLQYQNLMQY